MPCVAVTVNIEPARKKMPYLVDTVIIRVCSWRYSPKV